MEATEPAMPNGRPAPRILVAEDDDVNQLVVRRMLEAMGYPHVTIVADGEAALHACGQQRFDLILMDWQMPRLGGEGATVELRRRGVRTPVVALTATASAEECRRAGTDDHMTKPVSRAVLAATVRRWTGIG